MKKIISTICITSALVLLCACSSTTNKANTDQAYQEGATDAENDSVSGPTCTTDDCKASYTQGMQDEITAKSTASK